MRPAPVVELAGVRVARPGGFVLQAPALAVEPGEVLAVLGPNGSGKSTLLQVLGFLRAPDAGQVRFDGRPVAPGGALAARRRVATVFQQPMLAEGSVADNVGLGLRFRGVPRAERTRRVRPWLERFGILEVAGRPARALSGGQAQRVALARALVLAPDLLLLDEPFAALDEPTRAALLGELREILRAEAVTTVLVTHDRGEALALADRVAVLLGGRPEQVGPTAEVFRAPASEAVARFLGVETIVSGQVVAGGAGPTVVAVPGGRVEAAAPAVPGQPVRLCIRPEDVTLVAAGADGASGAGNRFAGRVTRITPTPSHVLVALDCGFPLVAAVTHRALAELALAPGAPVVAVFTARAVHLIPAAGPAVLAGAGSP